MKKHWLSEELGNEEPTVAGVPTEMMDEAVTGVVIDMDMEDKLREILRQDLFMRPADIDAIFEHARNWEWGKPKPQLKWPARRRL